MAFLAEWDRSLLTSEEQWRLARIRIGGLPQSDGIQTEDIRVAIDHAVAVTVTCYERVTTLGPEKVEEAAHELLQDLHELRIPVWNLSGPPGARQRNARRVDPCPSLDARPEFVTAVREVLQTPPRPRA
ncbi:hypothetical protein [Streptomyces sp. NPDC005181]|uniref:hypothetical protein n=1 Tax=Streptomyces sp. NPDC005181 TaxID=3156869 RepID=UPI0033B6947D